MNLISFPIVQVFYSPGIVEISMIRNLHWFLIIVLILPSMLSSLFKKTNKTLKKRPEMAQASILWFVSLILPIEIKYPDDYSFQFEFSILYLAFAFFRNSPLKDFHRIDWGLFLIILTLHHPILSLSLTSDTMKMIS